MKSILNWLNPFSLFWALIIYGTAFYVYKELGYVPQYSNPDPKEIITNFDVLFKLFILSIPFLIIVSSLNIIYLLNSYIKRRKLYFLPSFFFPLLSIILLGIVIGIDPGGYLNWFLD